MLSFGMLASRAFSIAVPRAALAAGSAPPSRAATWIARASFVKSWPRLASVAAFLCLIEDHFECPDIDMQSRKRKPRPGNRGGVSKFLRTRRPLAGGVRPNGRAADALRLAAL